MIFPANETSTEFRDFLASHVWLPKGKWFNQHHTQFLHVFAVLWPLEPYAKEPQAIDLLDLEIDAYWDSYFMTHPTYSVGNNT